MAAAEQFDRIIFDIIVGMKQRSVTEFLHAEKNSHPLTLAERLWRPNSGCEHSEAVGGAFQ